MADPKRNYRRASWDEVKLKNHYAYDRFRDIVRGWLKHPELRTCFSVALDNARPTAENVMELFCVKAKWNWKWIGARPSDLLLSLVVASQNSSNVIRVEHVWNAHHPWWH